MAYKERVQILTESEQSNFYGPPVLNIEEQRFFFVLNDKELLEANTFRNRKLSCMFIVLFGYFKVKPVVLNPGYHQIKQDLKYVYQSVLPGIGFRPFNLSQKESERIYQRIFSLMDYQRWSLKKHQAELIKHLTEQAKAWLDPRNLFDESVGYLSNQKIAIPAYSTRSEFKKSLARS